MTYSVLATVTTLLLLASPAFAADGQNPSSGSSSTQTSSAPPADFLLGRPRAMVGVRGSWVMPSTGSDLYDFVTTNLNVEKSDFNTGSFGVEVAINVTPRLDILGGFDLNGMSQASDDRVYEDNKGLPIEQTTELEQFNLSMSAKFSLVPRGRAISRLAWIPRTVIPYVGAGGGFGNYTFRQNGDFVDYADLHVFTDTFRSSGWAPSAHVMGGTDVRVQRHLILSFEGKYTWSHADLDQDFVGFEPIDLGGFRFGAGVHFAF